MSIIVLLPMGAQPFIELRFLFPRLGLVFEYPVKTTIGAKLTEQALSIEDYSKGNIVVKKNRTIRIRFLKIFAPFLCLLREIVFILKLVVHHLSVPELGRCTIGLERILLFTVIVVVLFELDFFYRQLAFRQPCSTP